MKEKQMRIEKGELFSILSNTINGANFDDLNEAVYKIYDVAGYRKQSEGEWVKVYSNEIATVYECSECRHLDFGISEYCICGAKMKGGEGK